MRVKNESLKKVKQKLRGNIRANNKQVKRFTEPGGRVGRAGRHFPIRPFS